MLYPTASPLLAQLVSVVLAFFVIWLLLQLIGQLLHALHTANVAAKSASGTARPGLHNPHWRRAFVRAFLR